MTTYFLEMSMDMALPPLVNVLFLYECVQISLVTTNWLCLCLSKFPSGPQKAITARGKGAGANAHGHDQFLQLAPHACVFPSASDSEKSSRLVQQVPGKPVPYLNPGCHTSPALRPSTLAEVMITPKISIPIQLE